LSPNGFDRPNDRSSDKVHIALSDRHHTLHTQQTYWSYEDIGLFFFAALFLGVLLHSAVRLHLLSATSLNRPTRALQTVVLLSLLSCLYAILKLRYRRHVWRALGWIRPSLRYAVIAVLGGAALAIAVALFVHRSRWVMPPIRFWDLALFGAILGPALEESFFRGCLLPVLARTVSVPAAVGLSALLFTALHKPPTPAQWVCFTTTGVAYGWMRVRSHSTAAAGLMHSAYNVTLFLCQLAGLC
jgi:membrane protease YdiL (CAAX protease family)